MSTESSSTDSILVVRLWSAPLLDAMIGTKKYEKIVAPNVAAERGSSEANKQLLMCRPPSKDWTAEDVRFSAGMVTIVDMQKEVNDNHRWWMYFLKTMRAKTGKGPSQEEAEKDWFFVCTDATIIDHIRDLLPSTHDMDFFSLFTGCLHAVAFFPKTLAEYETLRAAGLECKNDNATNEISGCLSQKLVD